MSQGEITKSSLDLSTPVASALRYWRTLHHLKPVQIFGRARRLLPYAPLGDEPPPSLRARGGGWVPPAARRPSMQGRNCVQFLNVSGHIDSAADWNATGKSKLWLYNLHYFDDLNAATHTARKDWHQALIVRWIDENPPGEGTGWEPYPLSLRIVNWIKWALAGNKLNEFAVRSLAMQARYLRQRIEWHLLGNHLFANAKTLLFAGLFFEGDEADVWRDIGLTILTRELSEQILDDGGHFELSPMYHSLIEEDLLDLTNLARTYPGTVPEETIEVCTAALRNMRQWRAVMLHPDGGISFFNDAAHAIAPEPNELDSYAGRLQLESVHAPRDGITHLAPSGYVRVQQGDMVALLDVGEIGPDYLPGHAHADTLSFELSLSGHRVFVNSGTSLYEEGAERLDQRSTASHNTVEVDGENSSEVWGAFRVARRARPYGLRIENKAGSVIVACAHDGYRRLPGKVMHWRTWRFDPNAIMVEDRLEGTFTKAKNFLHLHPKISVFPREERLMFPNNRCLKYRVTQGAVIVRDYAYHPEFGLSQPAQCLDVAFASGHCAFTLSLGQDR